MQGSPSEDNDLDLNNRAPEEEDYNLEELNLNISLKSSLSAKKNAHLLKMQQAVRIDHLHKSDASVQDTHYELPGADLNTVREKTTDTL